MGKYLVLFYFILCVFSAHAQYCRIQKGMTAYYITQDLKKNKTLKDTSYIADVVDKGDRLIIKEVFHGDLYDSQAVKDGTNIQFRIYYKNQGITEYIILDSKSENESMKKYIYSKYSQNQLKEAEHEYQQYSKSSHCEGRISIPLKENANIGEKIPPCSYSQKTGIINMKASLKGKYLGRDNIHTPSGNYDCIKIYTESKGKIMFVSESEYSIDWYAKNVGLVKSETVTKKGKVLLSTLLYAIKQQ